MAEWSEIVRRNPKQIRHTYRNRKPPNGQINIQVVLLSISATIRRCRCFFAIKKKTETATEYMQMNSMCAIGGEKVCAVSLT